ASGVDVRVAAVAAVAAVVIGLAGGGAASARGAGLAIGEASGALSATFGGSPRRPMTKAATIAVSAIAPVASHATGRRARGGAATGTGTGVEIVGGSSPKEAVVRGRGGRDSGRRKRPRSDAAGSLAGRDFW